MERFEKTKLVGIVSLMGNLLLILLKGIIGFMTNSKAMIADFFNSLGDVVSSTMTFIGSKIASKPRDDDHNLGYGKAEYIFSLLISIVFFIMAYTTCKESILSLINNSKYNFSIYLIVVCIITILVKLGLYIYAMCIYKKHKNLLLKANATDHRNDILLTCLTLFSVICSYYDLYFVDGIVGIIISVWIFISMLGIFLKSYDVLMDKSINKETKKKVMDIIHSHEEIKKVQHFNSTPVGYQYQISFTIFVDGNLSTFESHEIANNLEKEIKKKIDEIYLTVIHVNPM